MGVMEKILDEMQNINQKLDNLGNHEYTKDNVYNAEEAAEYLKISKDKVYELMRKRKLGFIKIGNRRVTTDKLLQGYIKENTADTLDKKEFENDITALGG